MDNERAIDLVNKYTMNGKADEMARVFLCEDILDLGVDEWVSRDVEDLMLSMVDYIADGATRSINRSSSNLTSNVSKEKIEGYASRLKDQMITTYRSMAKYASVHAKISDDYFTGLWTRDC